MKAAEEERKQTQWNPQPCMVKDEKALYGKQKKAIVNPVSKIKKQLEMNGKKKSL
jgi:hypothetical protein